MIRLCWCVIIISVLTLPLCAQDRLLFSRNEADSVSRSLYQKYLSKPGNEEDKMKELLQLAINDDDKGELQGALRKFQIGLMLEKNVPPGLTTFEFNLRLGEIIARINRGYALEFFTKAAHAAKMDPSIHPSRVYHMYNNKALSHQHLMEYDSAVYYYKEAIEAAQNDNPVSVSSTLNNLGMFYAERQTYDSAHHYFQKALDILGDKENHITLYTSIKDNIAQLNILEKRYDLAIPIFRFNDSVYLPHNPWNYVVNKVRLLKALEQVKDPSIHSIIQELQDYTENHQDKMTENVLLDFYSFANDYYFTTGQHNHQVFFREKMKELSTSLDKKNLEQLDQLGKMLLDMQEASLRSDISAYQLQAQQQQFQIRSILFVSIAATLSLCLIILLLIVYLRKRRYQLLTERKLADVELQRKEMEARLLEQDLLLKKRDLTNVVLHNTQVYDTNQKLIERIEEIRKNKNTQDDELRSLLIDLQSKNQICDRTIGLQSNIESVNAEFHERLKSNFPDLTKSEEELCGYVRINLSTKDISILKNVAASSVKMSKTRLRKKLGVAPEEDLYEFIRGI